MEYPEGLFLSTSESYYTMQWSPICIFCIVYLDLINLMGSDQTYRMLLVQEKNWRASRLSSCHAPSHCLNYRARKDPSFNLTNLIFKETTINLRMLLVQEKNWRASRLSSCHVPSHEVMIKTTDQSWSTKRAQFQSSNPCLFNLYISMAVYHSVLFLRNIIRKIAWCCMRHMN